MYKQIGMVLNSERETYPHNWHMPEEASVIEVPTAAWWQGQQELLHPSVSVVVTEPQQADLMLLVSTSMWRPW